MRDRWREREAPASRRARGSWRSLGRERTEIDQEPHYLK